MSTGLTREIFGEPEDDAFYTFTLGADDGFIRTERTFEVMVKGNSAPTWNTPSTLEKGLENTLYEVYLSAGDVDGDDLTFEIISDNFPLRDDEKVLKLDTSGRLSGMLPNVTADETYSFDVRVSDPKGKSATRSFTLVNENNRINYDPHSEKVVLFANAENSTFDTVLQVGVRDYNGNAQPFSFIARSQS